MSDHRTEHERVFELLPWLVNGRLNTHEYPLVTQHLEQCPHCRAELAAQQRISAAINQPSKVEFAPQASFNKLWDRIATDEPMGRVSAFEALKQGWSACKHWSVRNWLPIAASVQTLVIVGLIAALALSTTSNIRNDTTAGRAVATSSVNASAIIRVVFDDATRLADVKDILNRSQLTVAAGPTAAGVYSLVAANKNRPFDLQETLNCLREDPRVRFVELAKR